MWMFESKQFLVELHDNITIVQNNHMFVKWVFSFQYCFASFCILREIQFQNFLFEIVSGLV